MRQGICYIVGAGDWFEMDFRPAENDFVIAADAGLRYLEQVGISADLVIGDFDTLEEIPTGANLVRLNCEKDDTDMLAAVREGIKAGYKEFHIYGDRRRKYCSHECYIADRFKGGGGDE